LALTLAQLAAIAGGQVHGDPQVLIHRVATLQDAGPGDITFLANQRYRSQLTATRASAVILAEQDAEVCPTHCLVCPNPYLAHARVAEVLHPARTLEPGIDPTATIDPSARIGRGVRIGANCYLGPSVVLADGVDLGPNCVLLDGVEVGEGSRLVASVTLCSGTRLGARCLIHPGAVIGSDGFGLANDNGVWVKVPQVGCAVLGDDVEVGSCTSIDRGAIGDTVIATGVKIDSQVHIAHNVQIGRHTAIAGCAAVAGSSRVGDFCTIAGGAGITGHVVLGDHVHVSGATAVTRSLPEPGVYTGTVPAMEHSAWQKNFARLRHLEEMQRRLRVLERALAALQDTAGATSGPATPSQ
jgi:UDP-3-O-[3-hydroxymyristoyl] glucosamine N-acyltransferase